jgi:hypothetical protein
MDLCKVQSMICANHPRNIPNQKIGKANGIMIGMVAHPWQNGSLGEQENTKLGLRLQWDTKNTD